VQDKLAVHDFIAQGMEHKNELILRTGSRVLIFHFRFKTSEKKSYEAVEIVISKFLQSLQRRERMCNIS
jgi:hypothetical protein